MTAQKEEVACEYWKVLMFSSSVALRLFILETIWSYSSFNETSLVNFKSWNWSMLATALSTLNFLPHDLTVKLQNLSINWSLVWLSPISLKFPSLFNTEFSQR
ncbi:hypothetical protein WICPIJ_002271 [Wickerhamomyces pijperi]|uniref:Uncharacterized protein n=1 Tax=Wickerhamomyces pijperi TaxID=599730 RepID=A0A9P8TQ09_WICPI|nr:hypothetical protein WICPIJ_002271 [Wickerhamomyces pijperi]